MKSSIGILLLLLFSVCAVYSQDYDTYSIKSQPYVEMLYHSGIFWSRTENLQEQFEQGYRAYEARLGFQTTGRKAWHQLNDFPKYGVGLHYADLVKGQKDTVVGNPFSVFGFFSGPWTRFGRFSLNSDLSVGLSYTPLIYDPVMNPVNDVIASHINLYFGFNLNLNMALSPRYKLSAAYGLTHHSNGRIQVPQKGVNSWGWSLGLSYLLNEPVPVFTREELPEFRPFESLQFMTAVGTVEDMTYPGSIEMSHYFNFSFTTDYAYTFQPKTALTLGLDVLYDGSLEVAIKGTPPGEVTTYQKMYLGSHLGYQYTINRLTLLFNLGTYFLQSSYDRGYWFGRAGCRISLTDQVYAHICIKTKNGVRSDWIEWGVAYHMKFR